LIFNIDIFGDPDLSALATERLAGCGPDDHVISFCTHSGAVVVQHLDRRVDDYTLTTTQFTDWQTDGYRAGSRGGTA
jgi:hypothetical protein